MSQTQPIRRDEDIKKVKDYFLQNREWRNYALVVLGLNTALRISDILALTWESVYNFEKKEYKRYLTVIEKKTHKQTRIYLNQNSLAALEILRQHTKDIFPEAVIFKSRVGENQPINRYQAYKIIRTAGKCVGLEYDISCHSLRKTFGYHAWRQGIQPAVLMDLYNHSSFEITKRYLSINQDDKDFVYQKVEL